MIRDKLNQLSCGNAIASLKKILLHMEYSVFWQFLWLKENYFQNFYSIEPE